MTRAQLDAVMAIETEVYEFAWTRGNFVDSLAAGYPALLLCGDTGAVTGYCVAMYGVDELHLLNITIAPAARRHGHARFMLESLQALGIERGARQLWLEVREGNAVALAVYARLGFARTGMRRGYYPAAHGRRENAIVMSRPIAALPATGHDALD